MKKFNLDAEEVCLIVISLLLLLYLILGSHGQIRNSICQNGSEELREQTMRYLFINELYTPKVLPAPMLRESKARYRTQMRSLSKRQEAILSFISGYIKQYNYSPTFREIARATNIPSTSIIFIDLNLLESRGYITRRRTLSRSISITKQESYLTIRSIPATNEIKVFLNTNSPAVQGIFS